MNKPEKYAIIVPAAIPTRLKPKAPKDSLRVLKNLCRDSEVKAFSKPLKNRSKIARNVVVKVFLLVGPFLLSQLIILL